MERRLTTEDPPREPEIGKADSVVGVKMGEKNAIRFLEQRPLPKLKEPDGRTASGIDQDLLFACFHKNAGTEAVGAGPRVTGAQQGNTEEKRRRVFHSMHWLQKRQNTKSG